jgi:hypothetical protein
MGLYLSGVWIPLKTQREYKRLCKLRPVKLWVGGEVGIVVANCTINLTQYRYASNLFPLAL